MRRRDRDREIALLPAHVRPPDDGPWHSVLVCLRFVAHLLIGVVMFGAVAMATLSLHQFTATLEQAHLPDYVLLGMKAVELLVFTVDMTAFSWFTLLETRRFFRNL